MDIIINLGEVTDLLKIIYPCAESDFDTEFDDKIILIANLLGFDFLGSGYNFKTKSRDMVFEKNQDFQGIEKIITDLENKVNPKPESVKELSNDI